MSLIKITDLTFAYEGSADNVFEQVCLTLDTDWRTGLVGRNGRGKTTLLRILLGRLPYSGSITAPAELEYFPLEIARRDGSVADVVGRLAPLAEEWEIERELSLVGLGGRTNAEFDCLSEGERVKAQIAAMFLREGGFPLIDEPTNHLDAAGRRKLAAYLSGKRGFIVVSHDRAFLDGCVDHIVSINRNDIEVRKGNFSAWLADIEAREAGERERDAKISKEIDRLKATAERNKSWAGDAEKAKFGGGEFVDRGYIGHKAAKVMKRAKSAERRMDRAVEEKSALLAGAEYAGELALSPLPLPACATVLSLAGAGVRRDGRLLFDGLSLTVERGDRIAVRGANGCGKSTLLGLICGDDIPHDGNVFRRSGIVVSRLRQTCDFDGTPEEYAVREGVDITRFFTLLARLGFYGKDRKHSVRDMSDGQRKKVMLAAAICKRAHLYVWDEPLNFIDVISRSQLKKAVLDSGATMIFVEHDEDFSRAAATGTVDL